MTTIFFLSFFYLLFGLFNAHSFRFCVNPQMNVAIKSTLIGQFDIWMKNKSEKQTHTHTCSYSNSTRIKAWIQSVFRGLWKSNEKCKRIISAYITRQIAMESKAKRNKSNKFLIVFRLVESLITVGFPFPIWFFMAFSQ